MPFGSIEEPEYTAELNMVTHGLMGDLHDVNSCLRSLKLKFELLRNPSHPDLKYWREARKRNISESMSTPYESSTISATVTDNTVKDSSPVADEQESSKPVCEDSKGQAIINGHAEMGGAAQNGLVSVKQERPSTPPPTLDGPGDSNNNIQDKKVPVLSSAVANSSSESNGSVGTSNESGIESSRGRLSAVKKEEEPSSPIPALVPVGGQTSYVKSAPATDKGKPEATLNTNSDISQTSVKSEDDTKGTGQPAELKSSGESPEVKPKSSVESPRAETSEVKVPTGDPKAQVGSDAHIKQETELTTTAQSGLAAVTDVKEEKQSESVQSLSDEEEIGAMNNLLGDINQIHDDLEERMDEIERQLTVLEEAYGGTPSQLTKKTDFRKLVKDLSRVRRLLQQFS